MKQAMLNVTLSHEIHNRSNGEIGICTCIQMEKQFRSGRTKPYRTICSYEIKPIEKLPAELRKLHHLRRLLSKFLMNRRAA